MTENKKQKPAQPSQPQKKASQKSNAWCRNPEESESAKSPWHCSKNSDHSLILPMNEEPDETLKQITPTATTKTRIYADYKGEEANQGSINFASTIFTITWKKDKILAVSTMEYSKCVKCLADTFDGGWRYAKKW